MAASLYEMQRCPIDSAMYYDAQLWVEYGGLYHVPSLEPSKTYYAFKQFGELYEQRNWCRTSEHKDNVFSCAAVGEKKLLCISNINETEKEIQLQMSEKISQVILTDKTHDYEISDFENDGKLTLPPYSFATIYAE